MIILLALLCLVFSAGGTRIFSALAQNTRLMDKPNERSLHFKPTVRGGGVIFIGLSLLYVPLLCAMTDTPFQDQLVWVVGVLMLACVSFVDDLYQLSAKSRLLIQCVVASGICLLMSPATMDFLYFSLSNQFVCGAFVFVMVIWAINHFNFMDGLDGFCASQAIFLFLAYALLFGLHDAVTYLALCIVFTLNLSGFLWFNFPPAKLFMGDIGSASLGLMTFCVALIAQQKYQIPILYWFVLNGLFLFDAGVTLIRRILNKERWYSAHRKHAYQRLKQFGLDTRLILLGQALINLSFLAMILLLEQDKLQLTPLLVLVVSILILAYSLVEKLFPMQQCSERIKVE